MSMTGVKLVVSSGHFIDRRADSGEPASLMKMF